MTTIGPYGIVSRLFQLLRRPTDFPVFMYGADLQPQVRERIGEADERLPAAAAGFTRRSAMASTLGEAVERYAFATYAPSKGSLTQSNGTSLNALQDFPFLIPDGVSETAFYEQLEAVGIGWVAAENLSIHESARVPAVLLSPATSHPNVVVTTNGMACGNCLEDATLHGLYEVIERDAVMLAWYRGRPGHRLELCAVLAPEAMRMVGEMEQLNIHVCLRDVTTDLGIPAVLAIVYRAKAGTVLSCACGAASALSPRRAATRAFLEAALSWRAGDDLLEARKGIPEEAGMPSPENFSDHAYLYQMPWMMKGVEFLLADTEEVAPSVAEPGEAAEENALGECLSRLGRRGRHVLLVDMTPADVAEFGLKVVRVIVPGLVPLFVGRNHAFHVPRMKSAGEQWAQGQEREFNPYPHPFP